MTDDKTLDIEQPQASPSSFGGLERIEPAKDIQTREQTTLEKLIKVKEELLKHFSVESLNTKDNYENTYQQMYRQVKSELTSLDFNEHDISYFVIAEANKDSDEESAIILGLYTGCLAHVLTERNNAVGKRTTIYIDGKGNKFDYLFLHAKVVDRLFVENFKGENICTYLASFGGHANQIICKDIYGFATLKNVGYSGTVEQIIGFRIAAHNTLDEVAVQGGAVNQIIAVYIAGNQVLHYLGAGKGKVGQVIASDIRGDEVASWIGFERGQLLQLIALNIKGEDALKGIGRWDSTVQQVTFCNVPCSQHDMKCDNIINGKTDRTMYQEILRKNHIKEIIKLVKSLNRASQREKLAIADEIYALRQEVPKEFFK